MGEPRAHFELKAGNVSIIIVWKLFRWGMYFGFANKEYLWNKDNYI